MTNRSMHLILLLSLLGIFFWSVIHPKELLTWIFEAIPAIIGVALVLSVYPKFKFTNLTYFLLWIDVIIILVGAHYTYEAVPLFEWIQDKLNLSRNHYDRLAHFTLGFTGASIVRELLVQKSPVKKGKLLFAMVISSIMALGAIYEIIEFAIALISGSETHAFLGAQGDIWDAQWDLLMALCGAVVSFITLGRYYEGKFMG